MSIKKNIEEIKASLPEKVKLVAVSKYKPNEDILEAYAAGQRIFGENKVQEMVQKHDTLPPDIEWHLIGHLQTNKVKYMASFVSMIHSIDSLKLLEAVNHEAQKNNRVIPCLLQFHIAEECTKFGLSFKDAQDLLQSESYKSMQNIFIAGVMGMGTNVDNDDQTRAEFIHLKSIFDDLRKEFFENDPRFKEISMGMSDDYRIAVEQGSTMVRIGSSIFGVRN